MFMNTSTLTRWSSLFAAIGLFIGTFLLVTPTHAQVTDEMLRGVPTLYETSEIDVSCPVPTELAYNAPGERAVYYVTAECTKRPFSREDIFNTYFNDWDEVLINERINEVPDDTLGFMPYGPKYDPKFGALVKTLNDPQVYLLLGGEKKWIASEEVFNALNYDWAWVEDVDPRLLDQYISGGEITDTSAHPNYTLVKTPNSPQVFRLEPDPTDPTKQVKRHIPDEEVFNSLGFRFDRIVELAEENIENVENGEELSMEAVEAEFADAFGSLFSGLLDALEDTFADMGNMLEEGFDESMFAELDQYAGELEPMTADDCYPGEVYDEADQMCYVECDSDIECEALFAEIDAYAASLEEEFLEDRAGDVPFADDAPNDGESLVVHYDVRGDVLGEAVSGPAVDNQSRVVSNSATHNQIWRLFTRTIPLTARQDVVRYEIFSDGADGIMAYVTPEDEDISRWYLGMDPADAYLADGTFNERETLHTLLHEYAHVFTLREGQLVAGITPERCGNYHPGEGCAIKDSYINQFHDRFWADIIDEVPEENADDETASIAFYEKYQDRFLTEYAAVSLPEDIAESWTLFVIGNARPAGDTVAEQKILFFYQFREMITLREKIRSTFSDVARQRR